MREIPKNHRRVADSGKRVLLKKGLDEPWEVIADDLADPSKRSWIDDSEKIMRKYAETMANAWVQRNETAVSFFLR
eukprot:TRINITY_DN2347_c0_g1_i1.p2 TRINITY_DN2347_c0_g1~~TRINITY_DN2347_c0_g1_i1.p2  ORF type:complete len:76 (-),score=5.28 TRINITY_DN2347_c0_g1_i1:71-298(-)